jgi:dTDP-4-dehydrorhamnose 3,5-epimerase
MDSNPIKTIKLEKHETKDVNDQHVNGSLVVVWRDWDKLISSDPKMVYVSSVNPGEVKGPHLHTKRDSYFVCLKGKVVFIIKDDQGKYHEIESSEEDPVLVQIPKNFPSAHINTSSEISSILALASISWRPNDDEMKNISFDDYDWKKWDTL